MSVWFKSWKKEQKSFKEFRKDFYTQFLDPISNTTFDELIHQFKPPAGCTPYTLAKAFRYHLDSALVLLPGGKARNAAKYNSFQHIKTLYGPDYWNTMPKGEKGAATNLDELIKAFEDMKDVTEMMPMSFKHLSSNPSAEASEVVQDLPKKAYVPRSNYPPRGNAPYPNRGYFNKNQAPGPTNKVNLAAQADVPDYLEPLCQVIANLQHSQEEMLQHQMKTNHQPEPARATTTVTPEEQTYRYNKRKLAGVPPAVNDTIPCSYCKNSSHPSKLCFRRTYDFDLDYPEELACILCNTKPGHYMNQCELCANCKEKGHRRLQCPATPRNRQGNRMQPSQ
jgi:hypothetical protein